MLFTTIYSSKNSIVENFKTTVADFEVSNKEHVSQPTFVAGSDFLTYKSSQYDSGANIHQKSHSMKGPLHFFENHMHIF